MVNPAQCVPGWLHKRPRAAVPLLAADGLANAGPHRVGRVVSQLEWLRYVAVRYGPAGEPAAVQLTDQGLGWTQTG
jgi:hypothetical protein